MALAGDPHARAVGDAGRNAHGQRLGPRLDALAVARPAQFLLQPASPPQVGQFLANTMWPRTDRTAPVPSHDDAARFGDAMKAAAGARAARVLSRDGHRPLHAVPRLFEGQRRLRVDVGAALGAFARLAARAREHLLEQFAEGGRALGVHAAREVEAGKPERRGIVSAMRRTNWPAS